MDFVRWDDRPKLRRPILIAAFEGWNDAADAASMAARWLAAEWGARTFGALDPDQFYDFTQQRPEVRLVDGHTRVIEWPDGELQACKIPGTPHDAVFLHAAEPHLRWKTYTGGVAEVASTLGVELALTLGALLAEVPHTRPIGITGSAATDELVQRLSLQRSRYEGPTGIVGVLHDALGRAGIPSASLWAAMPHYVAKTPSPKGALALVERALEVLGGRADVTELQLAAVEYERQVSDVVAEDDEVAAYVQRLEEVADSEPEGEVDVPNADALAREVERFLRNHSDPDH